MTGIKNFNSFNEQLSCGSDHSHAQRMQRVIVIHTDYRWGGEHGVVWPHVCRALGCLLDAIHFLGAANMIDGTNNDRLAYCDILCRCHICLNPPQVDLISLEHHMWLPQIERVGGSP